MRYLILSDIHGNGDALAAVCGAQRRRRIDAALVLGDLVGYGAEPDRVVEKIRSLPWPVHVVRGNHDRVVVDPALGESFNTAALEAATWTTQRLGEASLAYLNELPEGPREVEPGLIICHGSPLDEDDYLLSGADAAEVFLGAEFRVAFFGHTHVATAFILHPNGREVTASQVAASRLVLDPKARYLLNPGSVGQPRDRDPRAAYITYDTEVGEVRWHRLKYPIRRAQRRIREAGLPAVLADRLAAGI